MFNFLKHTDLEDLKLIPVDMGFKTIQIPVADFQSEIPGKTILITAGMDGDEYASIVAAYMLCDIFSKKKIKGRIIIIPLLNIPGFRQNVSFNPMDGKFPKYVFPGNQNGGPTERLIYWLWSRYVKEADLWIDLHGGAIDEIIQPFVWVYQTDNAATNKFLTKIMRSISSPLVIYEKNIIYSKDKFLAKNAIPHIILESGQSGIHTDSHVKNHIAWVSQILSALNSTKEISKKKKVYKKVNMYTAEKNGMWYSFLSNPKKIKKRQVFGEIRSFTNSLIESVKAKEEGIFLWGKESLNANKGDVLFATASEEKMI